MAELRALVSCRLVREHEAEVRHHLGEHGVDMTMPRFEGQQLEEAELLELLLPFDAILAGDDQLTRKVMESSPKLRVISKWGIGIDAIDTAAAAELGIKVMNTPGVFGEELADYALGFILMMARRQHEVDARVRQGEWHKIRGVSLAGKTLGVIGLGSSGRALVKRARAVSLNVLGYDIAVPEDLPGCELTSLDRVLAESDIISLHLPATPETSRMIDDSALAKMKEGVWLVNTSRGALIDEAALVRALTAARVGAVALDVFESEPVAADNPLLGMENVILGSHNGSNTRDAVERTTWMAVDNLLAGLEISEP